MYVHTYVHTHTDTYIHTHTNTHMYTHTHMSAQTDRQTYNHYLDCFLYFDLAPPMTTLYGFSGTSIKKSSSIAGHHLTLMFNLIADDP